MDSSIKRFVIGSGLGRDDLMLDYIPDILKLVSKE